MGRETTKMGFKRVTRNLLKLHSSAACGFVSAVLSPRGKSLTIKRAQKDQANIGFASVTV